jgi:hypothetical protein
MFLRRIGNLRTSALENPGRIGYYDGREDRVRTKALLLFMIVLLTNGCSKPPSVSLLEYSRELYKDPAVTAETFKGKKIAILPAAPIKFDPIQQEYRETIAAIIYMSFKEHPNAINLLPIDVTQSGINRTELWSDVLGMYQEYEASAVLRTETLMKIGRALDAQYVLMPKVLVFKQEDFNRARPFGISLLRTRRSTVSVQIQIWDADTGKVVWQGEGEGSEAAEVVEGRPVSFITAAQLACESLFYRFQASVAGEGNEGEKQ